MSDISPVSRTRRVRHELRRRRLTVRRVTWLTPHYLSLTLAGDELAGFTSLGFDDHIKLFLPGDPSPMRDYTPQRYGVTTGELDVEFAIHQPAGPATAWALAAKPGDVLEIGGPRGSFVIDDVFDFYLFIADEAAMPAVRRRMLELREDVPVRVIAITDTPAEPIPLPQRGNLTVEIVAPDLAAISARLASADRPDGEVYVWIAGEATLVRALRTLVVDELGYPAKWTKAAAYWRHGEIGEHEVIASGDGAEAAI